MDRPRVDYDRLASTYHSRYDGTNKLNGIADALSALASKYTGGDVLEAGCGTGRFLEALRSTGSTVYGVDASMGMLSQAAARLGPHGLAAADANRLPFVAAAFDVICCVNALHHFGDPERFIEDAAELVRPEGSLAIIGIDPRTIRLRYYYEYFEGALSLDLQRYPSFGQIVDWMSNSALDNVELRIIETPLMRFEGPEILRDPFLTKTSNSLLALLPDDVYEAGLQRIQAAADAGKEFWSELPFGMITGIRRSSASATRTE